MKLPSSTKRLWSQWHFCCEELSGIQLQDWNSETQPKYQTFTKLWDSWATVPVKWRKTCKSTTCEPLKKNPKKNQKTKPTLDSASLTVLSIRLWVWLNIPVILLWYPNELGSYLHSYLWTRATGFRVRFKQLCLPISLSTFVYAMKSGFSSVPSSGYVWSLFAAPSLDLLFSKTYVSSVKNLSWWQKTFYQ